MPRPSSASGPRRSSVSWPTLALLSSSLDYRATLGSVARLAVPTLADWCAVDILEHGSIERLAVEHPDPEKVVLAMKLQERYPQDPESLGGVYGAANRPSRVLSRGHG